eukprot:CAMPEP_0173459680 /NCGR_PEP_ID=MMETSP1357-20121228/61827_1 /TAXON_ID=77926 /ORGANISM="Hemiselmis rufescens, Strain PCC563" /LENGTH=364 /DNA_ID=CAMNT_0014427163 /DNA_START=329 /DNA_END=1419 /DNA_ORIENTATION=+
MVELITDLICRPPRKKYDIEDLGPHSFHLHEEGGKGKVCIRRDLVLTNRQGHTLECSHYVPSWIDIDDADEGEQQPRTWQWQSQDLDAPDQGRNTNRDHDLWNLPLPRTPCVVYLHGNSGCRLDADDLVDEYLARGLSLFSFDFQGCGVSGGDYVTLGGLERSDLECVLDYLSGLACVSGIGLHGRSMGAATALMVASCERYYHLVAGMVLDSCYTSVRDVLRDLAQGYVGKVPLLPTVPLLPVGDMVERTIDALRAAVMTRAGFDLDAVDVMPSAKHCQAPVLIAHAEGDLLVSLHHSERLMEEYGGPKTVCIFPGGDHNSPRPDGFNARAADFLVECFTREKKRERLTRSSVYRVLKYAAYA